MAPVLSDCPICSGQLKSVKKQFDFKIEDIPFRTKQKYERQVCLKCGEEYIPADVATDMNKEFSTARAFIVEQDKLYSVTDSSPVIPMFGNEDLKFETWTKYQVIRGNIISPNPKRWHKGFIHYLRFMQTADSVKIVPASMPYEIYCLDTDVLSIASKQFVKPDDYFKLTSIAPSRLSSSSHLPVMGTLD